jgi:hypothetical protein
VTACAQGEDDSDEEEKKDGEDDFFGSSLLHGHIGTGAPADGAPNPEADAELQAQVLAEMSAEELQKQLVGGPVSATSSLCSVQRAPTPARFMESLVSTHSVLGEDALRVALPCPRACGARCWWRAACFISVVPLRSLCDRVMT